MGMRLLGKERFEIKSVSYEKMDQIYNKASVLAFPSVPWESFGIVIVEAMARGLPVVASDDPIRREIVGSAGLLVDPTNTDEYAKALKKALGKNWGDAPRKQAEKFSWDNIAKQYEELFENITKKR
jgi:glycosyltransferase involved in cell wall biosynthesis